MIDACSFVFSFLLLSHHIQESREEMKKEFKVRGMDEWITVSV